MLSEAVRIFQNKLFDFAQYNTALSLTPQSVICTSQSPTPRSVRQFWIFGHFNFVQYNTARSHVFREHLCENEFFSETVLDCLSGTQVGSIHEETKNTKNLKTLPL